MSNITFRMPAAGNGDLELLEDVVESVSNAVEGNYTATRAAHDFRFRTQWQLRDHLVAGGKFEKRVGNDGRERFLPTPASVDAGEFKIVNSHTPIFRKPIKAWLALTSPDYIPVFVKRF